MSHFTGRAKASIDQMSDFWNGYIEDRQLNVGELALPSSKYPGPKVRPDAEMVRLFSPFYKKVRVEDQKLWTYAEFKALCLQHYPKA